MFEKRLPLKANRSQLEVVVTVHINVFSFYGKTTLRYFFSFVLTMLFVMHLVFSFHLLSKLLCWAVEANRISFSFSARKMTIFYFRRFIFRPKNPRKTAVNAMNGRTNEMLKSEDSSDIRGFRCNKQQAACLCVWAISDISRWPIHPNHTA